MRIFFFIFAEYVKDVLSCDSFEFCVAGMATEVKATQLDTVRVEFLFCNDRKEFQQALTDV